MFAPLHLTWRFGSDVPVEAQDECVFSQFGSLEQVHERCSRGGVCVFIIQCLMDETGHLRDIWALVLFYAHHHCVNSVPQ